MRLYTRTGDRGETSLLDGTRVPKDDLHICACGAVDEFNTLLGWCRLAAAGGVTEAMLAEIQRELFAIGAELAVPGAAGPSAAVPVLPAEAGARLERWIDAASAAAPPLRNFVLPAGCELAVRLHIARACCRRAERSVIRLHRAAPVSEHVLVYLNRLSDLLFAWARQANHEAGVPDVPWIP